jgi:hypothetical protein
VAAASASEGAVGSGDERPAQDVGTGRRVQRATRHRLKSQAVLAILSFFLSFWEVYIDRFIHYFIHHGDNNAVYWYACLSYSQHNVKILEPCISYM